MNIFRPFIDPAIAAGKVAFCIGLFAAGWHIGSKHIQAKWDAAKLEQRDATLELERETRRAFDAIAVNAQKEKTSAQATIDSLRADLRSGAERLSVAVAACPTGGSPSGYQQTRADLLPEVADRIVGIAADADDAVRDLNECIDKYAAVRSASEAGRNQ